MVISEVEHPTNSHRKLNVEGVYLLCLNIDIKLLAPSTTSYEQGGWWARTLAENLWKPLKVMITGLEAYLNYILVLEAFQEGEGTVELCVLLCANR